MFGWEENQFVFKDVVWGSNRTLGGDGLRSWSTRGQG